MPPAQPSSSWPHTGAILAGGPSRRMGRPKQTLRLPDGRILIEPVAEALRAVCREVVIVGKTGALPALRRVSDRREAQSALVGIEAILASSLDRQYVVCPCDLPLISADVLRALTAPTDAMATVLRFGGEARPRPLPARISEAALPRVRSMLDRDAHTLFALMASLATDEVAAPDEWIDSLLNVNTPEDLRAAMEAVEMRDAAN